jgi:DNA-binding response OmpR family regulator
MSNPIRILIVDDDVNLRKTLGDILKAKGFAPVPCETGMEALERVGQEEIVVALVDLRLADISGLFTADRVHPAHRPRFTGHGHRGREPGRLLLLSKTV